MPFQEGDHPRGEGGQFSGRATSKGGRTLYETSGHPSHEHAAKAALAGAPKARSITTSRGHHMDIRFHSPHSVQAYRTGDTVGASSTVNGHKTGYEIQTDEMGSNLPTIPANPSGGVPASSRERGMSVSDARRIIRRINDAWPMQAKTGEPEKAPKMSATGAAPAPAKPVGDARRAHNRLPTRDVFRRRVRDAVRAGKPIPKVLQFGTAWLGTSGGSPTWQPYDARDAARRSFKRAMRDACSCGQSAGDAIASAIDAGVDGIMDLGETGGHGVPMSGWVKAPGPPDDEDAADTKHFFKGSAKDTFRRWIRRGATVADAVMWATKQQDPDEWWSARNGISAEGAEVPRPPT